MIRLMFVHYTLKSVGLLSGHFLRNSCPLVWPFVLIVFWSICIFNYYHFSLKSEMWLTVSLSLSHWYPGSGVVLNCIDS